MKEGYSVRNRGYSIIDGYSTIQVLNWQEINQVDNIRWGNGIHYSPTTVAIFRIKWK